MTSVPTYQAPAFEWLDAIPIDNGNLDSRQASMDSCIRVYTNHPDRTYHVHQTIFPGSFDGFYRADPLDSSTGRQMYNRPTSMDTDLEDLDPEEAIFRNSRLEDWVNNNQQTTQSTGLEPTGEDWEDSRSIFSIETLVEGSHIPLQLEARPPYPTSTLTRSTWLVHNNQKPWEESHLTLPTTQDSDEDTDRDLDTNSCDDALFPFCQSLRPHAASTSTDNVDSTVAEPQWLIPLAGKVLFDKGRGAIRKLRRKLSHGSVEDGH